MFKRTLVSSLAAVAIVAGTLGAAVQPSAAGPHHHHGHGHGHGFGHSHGAAIGLGLGLGGFLLGSALAQPRTVVIEDYGSGHVRRCLARYRSYDPETDTYIGNDGYPRYCRL